MIIQFPRSRSVSSLVKLLVALLILAAFFLITRKYQQTDLAIYYDYSLKILQGQLPYVDFEVEYPPLALLPMVIPQLPSLLYRQSLLQYEICFFIQNLVLSYCIGKLILQIPSLQSNEAVKAIIFYTVLILLNLTTVFCRYDIFSTLLTLLALNSVLKNRSAFAGAWLGLGVAAKLYPVILLPIFSIYYLVKNQRYRCGKLLISCFATTALVFLPFVISGQSRFFSFLSYHKLRGLQMETIPAGILLLLHKLNLVNVQFELNYGAYHLVSPDAAFILRALPLLNLALFGLVLIGCLNQFRREYKTSGEISCESLISYITLTLLIFMLTAKVFSPQYIVWLLPFLTLLPLTRTSLSLWVTISAITSLIYPVLYGRLIDSQLLPVVLLNLRNVLLVAFTIYLLKKQFQNWTSDRKASLF